MGADGQERVAGMESRLWQMLMEGATALCSCCVESFEGSQALVPRKRTPGEPLLWGLLCHSPLSSLYLLWSERNCLPNSIYSRES